MVRIRQDLDTNTTPAPPRLTASDEKTRGTPIALSPVMRLIAVFVITTFLASSPAHADRHERGRVKLIIGAAMLSIACGLSIAQFAATGTWATHLNDLNHDAAGASELTAWVTLSLTSVIGSTGLGLLLSADRDLQPPHLTLRF